MNLWKIINFLKKVLTNLFQCSMMYLMKGENNMTHDMTFCVAISCPYKFTCKRHIANNNFEKDELVSQCEFKHTLTSCDYYIRKED